MRQLLDDAALGAMWLFGVLLDWVESLVERYEYRGKRRGIHDWAAYNEWYLPELNALYWGLPTNVMRNRGRAYLDSLDRRSEG